MPSLIRASQVAEQFAVTRGAIYKMVERRFLPPPIRLSHKVSVWDSDEVDSVIADVKASGKSSAEYKSYLKSRIKHLQDELKLLSC